MHFTNHHTKMVWEKKPKERKFDRKIIHSNDMIAMKDSQMCSHQIDQINCRLKKGWDAVSRAYIFMPSTNLQSALQSITHYTHTHHGVSVPVFRFTMFCQMTTKLCTQIVYVYAVSSFAWCLMPDLAISRGKVKMESSGRCLMHGNKIFLQHFTSPKIICC